MKNVSAAVVLYFDFRSAVREKKRVWSREFVVGMPIHLFVAQSFVCGSTHIMLSIMFKVACILTTVILSGSRRM